LLSAYFYRRKRHGTVFALAMICYPVQRFIEEIIRLDNPRDTFGLTISQGVSVVLLVIGLVYWLILLQMPLRSPRAVPFVPDDDSGESSEEPISVANEEAGC
jgi:prolipoprotein diacylglyceryltransferase